MEKIYYALLSQDLQNTYAEIEEDLIFSGLSLEYYYNRYKNMIGDEACKAVITALAGDRAFLTYEQASTEMVRNLLYADYVSNFRKSLAKELEFFAFSIDYLLKEAGIEEYDDFLIAGCLSYFLELRNIPCSAGMTEYEGSMVFCNLIQADNERMKVLIRNKTVISYPYDVTMSRDFIESMFIRIIKGGEIDDGRK